VQAGAGDDLLDDARLAGAEVYITSDLRHHPAAEALVWPGAPSLIDISHWAAEWTWLPVVQRQVDRALATRRVPSTVSRLCTDPWTGRI
jgi:putative NIF3 family GTP cyclohydrolase 1 type 2